MSSGRKVVRENTRERIISTDFNRLQSFVGGWGNEAMRRQMLAPQDDTFAVGTTFINPGPVSAAFDVLAPAAPDYAGILNGLMVIAPAAATYLLITSGMMLVVDPEGQAGSSDPLPLNPDDGPGPARLVYSEGVNVVGSLAWAPNPGPGTRVDIVEVQRSNVVAETDNRDIFDPSTGLFTPQAVTKVVVGDLTYRIRQGAPGGGLPAPALGWVPLAVIASAAGSVNLDTATLWDVRPLLSDLATPYAQVRSVFPEVTKYQMVCEDKSTPGQLKLSGLSQGEYLGWRMGGVLVEPDVTPYIDLLNAPFYQATGFVPVAGFPYYVYALWPGGYVRWVRYHPVPVAGAGGRVPGSYRGILTVSQTPQLNGQPIAPIALPPAWGLSTSTIFGQMLAAGQVNTLGNLTGFVADGDLVHHTAENGAGIAPFSIVAVGPGVDNVNFTVLPGVHFPAGSRRIRVALLIAITTLAAGNSIYMNQEAKVLTFAGGQILAELGTETTTQTQPSAFALLPITTMWDLPVAADGISFPPALGFQFQIGHFSTGAGNGTLAAATLLVLGWDL